MDSKISLSRTKADNRPYFGKYGEIAQLLMIPNNVSLDDLKHYRTETSEHVNWFGPSNTDLNPYYINNQRDNYDDRWRAFGYYNLKLNFTSWLHFSGNICSIIIVLSCSIQTVPIIQKRYWLMK